MLEMMIEKWSNRDGSDDYLWSLWQDGKRVTMGGHFDSADAAVAAGQLYCGERFGREADRTTHI